VSLKKFIKWCAIALAVLLVLLVAAWMSIGPVMKWIILSGIESQTGLIPTVEKFEFRPRAGILHVAGFRLHEQATNGGRLVLDLRELHVEVDPQAGEKGAMRFREIRLDLAEVVLTTNRLGGDLDRLVKQLGEPGVGSTNKADGPRFAGIDRLTLTLGSLKVPDASLPGGQREIPFNLNGQSFTNVTSTNLESILLYLGIKAGAGMLLGK
jgi:hypothetical protein